MRKPAAIKPLALTMGEPSGICGDITLAAWQALHENPEKCFFWIADRHWAKELAEQSDLSIVEIEHPAQAFEVFNQAIPLLHQALAEVPQKGQLNKANAPAVLDSIQHAVTLVQQGQAAAVVTNPIHKKILYEGAGFAYPGHTEYLAALAGVDQTVMMLACDALKVVPATIHIPLADVPSRLTTALLESTLRLMARALEDNFGIDRPRIAVAGLNPHAGEQGAFGTEEAAVITPVLDQLQAEGMAVSGPYAADTLFHAKARKNYDAALCMYHDQALIPIKTLAFDQGVNITLGLPFIRTAPDHGPALDIAAQGGADPGSLIAALHMAQAMAKRGSLQKD